MPPRHGFPKVGTTVRAVWRGLPAITVTTYVGGLLLDPTWVANAGEMTLCPTDSRTAVVPAMREVTRIGIRIGTDAARTYGPAPVCGIEGDRGLEGTIPRSMA